MGICLPSTLKVPHTYTWSPALIPKPLNWGDEIGIPEQKRVDVRYLRVLFPRPTII
jgi:hypothetical protein